MLTILVLVCALGQDPRECQPPTARHVTTLTRAGTPFECMTAQTQLDAAGVYAGEGEYLKVACIPTP